jgi:hypothetical protein
MSAYDGPDMHSADISLSEFVDHEEEEELE